MSRRLKLGLGLGVISLLIIGVATVAASMPPSSVDDQKEVVRARANKVCEAFRITCALEDSPASKRLQVLVGTRDGETARIVISYGDVPWRLIRAEMGCPNARNEFACMDSGSGRLISDDADVYFHEPATDPKQPSREDDETGRTPLFALQSDLDVLTGPPVAAGAWDDSWDDYFKSKDTQPLEPCRAGRKIWRANPDDGSSTRPPGLRDCLLVNRR